MTEPIWSWLDSPRGRALQQAESELLTEGLEDCFGWELVQLGAWGGEQKLLAGARTRRQTVVAGADWTSVTRCGASVCARLTQLPISSDSVDAVVLPHTLEFETDPYTLLREVDRILTGEGKLLLLGFQPLSLWGLRAAATRRGFPPGLRRLLTERRIRDWLGLLGFEVAVARSYLYEAPWGEPSEGTGRLLRRGLFYPLPAGAYLIKARKRVYAVPPLRLRLGARARVLGGLVEPSSARRT